MKASYKDIQVICENISRLYNDGLTLPQTINLMNEIPLDTKYKESLKNIRKCIEKGESLSEAFSTYENLYPKFFTGVLALGEESGQIYKVLKALGEYYGKQYEVKSKVREALTYPIMILIAFIALAIGFIFILLPIFYNVYSSMNTEIPSNIKSVFMFQNYIKENPFISFIYGIGILIIIFLIGSILRSQINLFNFIVKLNTVKSLIEYIYILILSVIIDSGVSLSLGLDLCLSSIDYSFLKKELFILNEDILNGYEVSYSMKKCQFISKYSLAMIKLGEDSGSLCERIKLLEDNLQKQYYNKLKKLLSAVQPIMLLFIGVIACIIIIYFLMPFIDMMYSVG